jgi:hypothetical protein
MSFPFASVSSDIIVALRINGGVARTPVAGGWRKSGAGESPFSKEAQLSRKSENEAYLGQKILV